jgi:hypothetical protein
MSISISQMSIKLSPKYPQHELSPDFPQHIMIQSSVIPRSESTLNKKRYIVSQHSTQWAASVSDFIVK